MTDARSPGDRVRAALAEGRLIGVVRQPDATLGWRAAEAFANGGIRLVEITLTTPSALSLIERLARGASKTGILAGAGTVLDAAAVNRAADAGASYIVSPVCDAEVLEVARERGLFTIPGAASPTEILAAWRAGADIVKVYPAALLGGPAYFRTVLEPLAHVPLLASGGVADDDVVPYLEAGASGVSVGSAALDLPALARGDSSSSVVAVQRIVRRVFVHLSGGGGPSTDAAEAPPS